mgnify:CR=1 FL=1
MNIVISRKYNTDETLGSLFVLLGYDLLFSCKTIELPYKGNQHNISCIPTGTYHTIKYNSPNKGWVFLLENVPGRSAIEIHAGNYATGKKIDTQGCILVGTGFEDIDGNGTMDIIESKKTLSRLMGILPQEFNLTII